MTDTIDAALVESLHGPSRNIHVTGLISERRKLDEVRPGSGKLTGIANPSPDHGMSQSGASRESDSDPAIEEVGREQPDRRRPHGISVSPAKETGRSGAKARRHRLTDPSPVGNEFSDRPLSDTVSDPELSNEAADRIAATAAKPAERSSTGLFRTWSWRLRLRKRWSNSSRQAARRAKVLGEIATSGGKDLGSIVRPSLADTWVVVREAAAKALGAIQDRESVSDLIDVLSTDESPAVRQAAALALCQLKDPEAISCLLVFLQTFPKLSLSISDGIIQIGRAGVPALLRALEDGEPGVKVSALELLGRLGDIRSVRSVVKGLSHSDERVRAATARCLGNLHDRRVELPLRQALARESSPTVIAGILRALGVLGCEGEPAGFYPYLQHASASCREAACQLVARLGDSRANGPLVQLLSDPEPEVRREAALALSQLAPPQAFPALVKLLGDPADEVRAAGCRALGGLHDSRALAPLCQALQDDYESVRIAAANALGLLGDSQAVALLCEAVLLERLQDPQIACIRALGQLADAGSLPALKQLLRRPTQVRTQAVVAIGQLATTEAVDVLIPLLEDPQAIIRYHAILGLGNIGDQRAIPALEKRISDPETLVLRGVVRAMGHFATAQAKILKGRAESALRAALDRPQDPAPQVSASRPKGGAQRILASPTAWLALISLIGAGGLGLWWGWGRTTVPEGTARGASLAFSRGDIAGLGASIDPNELRVATSGGWLERWNADTGQLVARAEKRIDIGATARFSADGSVLVTPLGNHLVVCDATTGEERSKVPVSQRLRWLRLDRRGEELASWEPEKGMTIWSLRSAQPVWQIDRDPDLPWSCVAVTEDFGRVAIGLTSGDVLVFDTGSTRRMTRLKSVMPQPSQLEFSPDGKILAVVNGRGQVVLMDPATNRVLESADCGVSGVAALAWTRDGNRLVGIGGDAIFQCERRDGRITRAAFAEQANRSGLVFDQLWVDPSDRHVAAASTQGRVVLLWSLPQLTPRASLQAP